MYCHNCGKEVIGNYCSHCGTKVAGGPAPDSAADWTTERDVDKLLRHPAVRKLIAGYADQSKENVSAQEFLALVDLAVVPLSGLSTKKIGDVMVPIYQKLGASTGKSARKEFEQTMQEVMVKSLCSLAKNGYPLDLCEAATNGVAIKASIPSDMWTWGGSIVISIEESGAASKIDIVTKIKGQFYDWGKSKKIIKQVFSDIESIKFGS